MVKILINCSLPQKEDDFLGLVKEFFPNLYDVKYLMTVCNSLKGGLQEVAEQVDVSYKFFAYLLDIGDLQVGCFLENQITK